MKITMDTSNLKTVFDACKSFVSKSDIHPALRAVQLNFSRKRCTAYATDGFKMMSLVVPYTDGDEGNMLVPIIKLPKDPFVTLSDEGNEIVFDFGGSKQAVKKYAGDFFENPERFFPTADPAYTIYFDVKNLSDALDAFKSKAVRLDFFGPLNACTITGPGRKALVFPVKPLKI